MVSFQLEDLNVPAVSPLLRSLIIVARSLPSDVRQSVT